MRFLGIGDAYCLKSDIALVVDNSFCATNLYVRGQTVIVQVKDVFPLGGQRLFISKVPCLLGSTQIEIHKHCLLSSFQAHSYSYMPFNPKIMSKIPEKTTFFAQFREPKKLQSSLNCHLFNSDVTGLSSEIINMINSYISNLIRHIRTVCVNSPPG